MNIYLVLEVQQRELEARVIFAAEAAKRGHKTYFGHKLNLYPVIKNLTPGIFFQKSLQVPKLKQLEKLKSLGHFNVSIDEEGLNRSCDTMYFRYKLSRKCLSFVDAFFSWGEDDKRLISKNFNESKDKIYSAGNSRIDLLKNPSFQEKKASELQSKYGEFLFFPTKFVRCNFYKNTWDTSKFGSFDPTKKIDTYAEAIKANIPDMSDDLYSELERNESWEKKNMELYMEAIGKCAQIYTTKNIIIRPHPAEDRKIWIDFARSLNLQNVKVVSTNDSILPWLMASYKTITHNCTTSIESALLGKNSINYTPIKDKDWEYELPLIVSSTARDFETLIELINKPKSKIYSDEEVAYYIKNWKDGTFCNNALDVLENLVDQKVYSIPNKELGFIKLFLLKCIKKIITFYSLYLGSGKYRREKFKQKFVGFNYKTVKNILDLYSDNSDINLSEKWPGVYLIERK